MKIFIRLAPLYLLLIIGCTFAASWNLLWPFPGWVRHTCFVVWWFSAVAFLLSFLAARVSK